MSRLASVVRTLCKFSGMKMKDVADSIGITPVTLSQNLAKDKPRTSTFDKLAHAFCVNAKDLEKMYYHPEDYELTHKQGGGIEIIPISFNALRRDSDETSLFNSSDETGIFTTYEVTAVFGCNGKLFYAYSLQDAKDITNILELISTTNNKEQEESLMSLLVNQYGKKKED